MTAHFQFFMILGAAILLLIIFALLKKGQMSVKYSLLWLALAVVLVIFAVFPMLFTSCVICWMYKCRSTWYLCSCSALCCWCCSV